MEILNHESEQEEESSNIHDYLATFNQGIVDVNDVDSLLEGSDGESSGGMYDYFSENELDEHMQIKEEPEDDYFQTISHTGLQKTTFSKNNGSKRAEIVRLGSRKQPVDGCAEEEVKGEEGEEEDFMIPALGEELHIDDQQALEMVAHLAEQAVSDAASKSANLPKLDGETSYQTVTIVPSDTNPGELSYVLFVSENEDGVDKIGRSGAMSIFDINDVSDLSQAFLNNPVNSSEHKMRAIRLSTRRSQLIAQQYICSYCPYTSPKRYLLSRHMKSHSEERPHKCSVCERGFKTVASLQNHVNTHTGTRPHPCKECNSCFTTSGELVRHVRYKHTHEKPHKCTECDYASVELSKLKRHMRCHTGERPYQCPHCTYASQDTYKLKRHLRIHTGEKPYECDICQARFTQSNSLKAHKLIHSGNKPVFKCEYCPTTCGRKTDLRIHMEKLHSSNKPHRCRRCAKVFLDRYSYKIHVRSHEGEKCYKCDLCEYASVSPRHLETHMLMHTDQKPFHCEECDMCFRQKQLLKRHKNLYHNPSYIKPEPKEKKNICAICFKAFRHKGNLLRHYPIHDPAATMSEREEALSVGKESGEEDYDSSSPTEKEDQQVVVFEVIQLPGNGSENSTLTMVGGESLTLHGLEKQGYSVIESVDDDADLLDFTDETFNNLEDTPNFTTVKTSPRTIKGFRGGTNPRMKKKQGAKMVGRARRGRPPNSKAVKIVTATPEKNLDTSDDIATLLNDQLEDDKTLVATKVEEIDEDLQACFDFSDKDVLLLSSENSNCATFHTDLEDIS